MNDFDEDFIPSDARPGKKKRPATIDRGGSFPYYSTPQALPNSTAVLVLGIVSIVVWPTGIPCGIISLVLHKKDKLLYNTAPLGTFTEQSFSAMNAGRICGIIGLCISSFFVFMFLIYFVFVFLIFGAIFAATTH